MDVRVPERKTVPGELDEAVSLREEPEVQVAEEERFSEEERAGEEPDREHLQEPEWPFAKEIAKSGPGEPFRRRQDRTRSSRRKERASSQATAASTGKSASA